MTLVTVIILNEYRRFGVMCIGGYVEVRFFNGWVWVGPDRYLNWVAWWGATKCNVGLCSLRFHGDFD
jgi:hypothetical protein